MPIFPRAAGAVTAGDDAHPAVVRLGIARTPKPRRLCRVRSGVRPRRSALDDARSPGADHQSPITTRLLHFEHDKMSSRGIWCWVLAAWLNAGRMSRSKVAIVTTLRDAGGMLELFVAIDRKTGFAHTGSAFSIIPLDLGFARLVDHPMVTTIAHDQDLRKSWAGLPEYQTYGFFIDREVMARQVLNAALAIDLARRQELDWLLHIDVDELFFSAKYPLAEHFARAQAQALDTIIYRHFEAVPEKADIADPFREVDLFASFRRGWRASFRGRAAPDRIHAPDSALEAL